MVAQSEPLLYRAMYGTHRLHRRAVHRALGALVALAACQAPDAAGQGAPPRVLRIATVDNAHLLMLQRLAPEFERAHPGVRLQWETLEEGPLRQAVSVDVATRGGRFDVVTLGLLEAPVWGRQGWLQALPDDPAYGVDDLLPPIREALSVDGRLVAAPFYGESSLTFYRRDLLERAGVQLPERPTWAQVRQAAAAVHDPRAGVHGICLRGRPGWGENMSLITTMVNTWGGQWFDMAWRPQLTSPAWRQAVGFYLELLRSHGPPSAAANGYNENLALFRAGRCAIWVDASVAASSLLAGDPAMRSRLGWAHAPVARSPKGSHWLWSWALAVPAGAREPALALRFVQWATSPAFSRLVAEREGWAAVPPGTRLSLYRTPAYQQAHPAAAMELAAILAARPGDATVPRSPYQGIQYVAIPEFQAIGTAVGLQLAEALAGRQSLDQALQKAQAAAEQKVREAGYLR